MEDCEELNPGCVCEEGYFEDKNGNCVTNDNCSVCYHPDSPDEPIEVRVPVQKKWNITNDCLLQMQFRYPCTKIRILFWRK